MRRWRWLAVIAVVAVIAALIAHWSASDGASEPPGVDDVAHGSGGSLRRTAKLSPESLSSLSGTVTDDAGPVARARVCAYVPDDEQDVCTTADDRGAYTIVPIAAGRYNVVASADEHLPSTAVELVLGDNEHRAGVDLILRSGGVELSGTVKDVDGGAISHARVTASRGADYARAPSVETDDAGAFRLWVWSGEIDLDVRADGYIDGFGVETPPAVVHFELASAGSLAGTVLDATTHEPVANASVVVASGGDSRFPAPLAKPSTTDEQGHFRVAGLEPGRYGVRANAPHGYGLLAGSVVVERAHEVDGVVVEVYPAVSIEARAVIAGSKQPCRDAWAMLRREEQQWVGRIDGDVIRFDGVLPGSYDVGLGCRGYVAPTPQPKLDVGERDVTGIVWEFADGATIRGRVTTATGEPVSDAVVSASGPSNGARAETDRDGAYAVRGLSPGKYGLVVASSAGVVAEPLTVVVAGRDVVTRDLRLVRGGEIRGTATSPTGAPVAGARIFESGGMTTTSDAAGHFALANLSTAHTYLVARTEDARAESIDIDVHVGQTSTITLVLQPTAAGQITGTVVDAANHPVADVSVEARTDVRNGNGTTTNSDGTFTVPSLRPGTYRVTATHPLAGTAVMSDVAVGGVAHLKLHPTGSIAGRVLGAPSQITVTLNGSRTATFYRTDGRFELDHVQPGHYEVVATDGVSDGHVALDLADGEQRTGVDIVLESNLAVAGRVIDLATRVPIGGVQVTASIGGARHAAVTGPDGRFRIPGVAHGMLAIETSHRPYASLYLQRDATTGALLDLGDVMLTHYRGDAPGPYTLGFVLDPTLHVVSLDPSAASAGLMVGDVVTAIDAIDVTGAPLEYLRPLFYSGEPMPVSLTLARGITITLVAAPR